MLFTNDATYKFINVLHINLKLPSVIDDLKLLAL